MTESHIGSKSQRRTPTRAAFDKAVNAQGWSAGRKGQLGEGASRLTRPGRIRNGHEHLSVYQILHTNNHTMYHLLNRHAKGSTVETVTWQYLFLKGNGTIARQGTTNQFSPDQSIYICDFLFPPSPPPLPLSLSPSWLQIFYFLNLLHQFLPTPTSQ